MESIIMETISAADYRATLSERAFQAQIVVAARQHGWRVYYQPDWVYRLIQQDMRRRRRGDRDWPDKGFPDLVLCKPPTLLIVENKSAGGAVKPEQKAWIADLHACGLDVRVWRPKDGDDIERLLAGEE